MADTRSIQSTLLNDAARAVLDQVAAVRINDTITISDFKLKSVSDNVASIEYSVVPSQTNVITSIELLKDDGAVLTRALVYVPVTQTIVSKHIITVKEGV